MYELYPSLGSSVVRDCGRGHKAGWRVLFPAICNLHPRRVPGSRSHQVNVGSKLSFCCMSHFEGESCL